MTSCCDFLRTDHVIGHAMTASWRTFLLFFLANSVGGGSLHTSITRADTALRARRAIDQRRDYHHKPSSRATNTSRGCYSCAYQGFHFSERNCHTDPCEDGMTCYKITAFVNGRGNAEPWVVHSCAKNEALDHIEKQGEVCTAASDVINKLDPKGAPSPGTTFNRCAIHTCRNSANDIDLKPCNDGSLGPLWCWEYAVEIDDDIIRDESKEFSSKSDFLRATQNWLKNQRNATKCSEQGLDTCLTLEGIYKNRRWSLQTCADKNAVNNLVASKDTCSYLRDTMSHSRMGKHVIKFNEKEPTSPPTTVESACQVKTCDTNGCNAQVPFFRLRRPTVAPGEAASTAPTPTEDSILTTITTNVVTGGSSSQALDTISTTPSKAQTLRPLWIVSTLWSILYFIVSVLLPETHEITFLS